MKDYLDKPVTTLKGVGEKSFEILSGKGIYTIYDILTHFPVFYINRDKVSESIIPEIPTVYSIDIRNVTIYRRFARRFSVINIFGSCCNEDIHIRIYNKPYLFEEIRKEKRTILFGPVYRHEKHLIMDNPFILDKKSKKIVPVYRNIGSIGSGKIEKFIEQALKGIKDVKEILPKELLNKRSFSDLKESFMKIHSPEATDLNDMGKVKERFKYTEFFLFQLELNYIRKMISMRPRIHFYKKSITPEDIEEKRVGFKLTPDQRKALKSILNDMHGKYGMQRILMGEVGSGKTVVAFCALLVSIINGFQGAMLAPTGILAHQHYKKGVEFFRGFKVALLTGRTSGKEKKVILEKLASGEIDLVFGTHSLIYEKVVFKNLTSIVIDEQHRFGVSQRAALFYKGSGTDLLVTTATPIPRTLLMSVYKDLSLSVIKTMPSRRKPVKTMIIDPSGRESFYQKLRREIEKGAQGYIVIPLIERSENFSGLRSLEEEIPFFNKIFKGIKTGVISGRSSEDEKNTIFDKFREGKISVVISTTVIEVGIDVRDATFIVIEDADRFGLAQLHQLRGRVGRGHLQSNCYLIPRPTMTERGKNRVKIIRNINDGFRIAEMDMEMRGSGVIQGFKQSGKFDFRLGDIKEDYELFTDAGEDSIFILENEDTQNRFIKQYLKNSEIKIKYLNFS